MSEQNSAFELLSRKAVFNSSVRHIKGSIALIDEVSSKRNLADLLSEMVQEKEIEQGQILAAVSLVLSDKLGYSGFSVNLPSTASDPAALQQEVAKWNAVDIVLVYHHPDVGVVVANPKNAQHASVIASFRKNELLVAYVGAFARKLDPAVAKTAAKKLFELAEGSKVQAKELQKGDCGYKQPTAKKQKAEKAPRAVKAPAAPKKRGRPTAAAKAAEAETVEEEKAVAAKAVAAAPAPAPKAPGRMTPQYSVVVANELFHNGNVEAWKRIIDSYRTKYPGLEVYIYYDGERIININSLFKWGKVKHGSTIQFAVAGDDIKDVAKLQRYLAQGASPAFEAFLHGPVNAVLKLF